MDFQAYVDPLIAKLQGWLQTAVTELPNVVVAVAVVALFAVLAKLARRVTRRMADRVGASEAIARLMSTIVKFAVVVIGIVVALGILGLQKTVVSLLAGAGIVGLAIGFAFQDLAANFIAGVAMGVRKPFQIGDVIKTGEYFGRVAGLNLRNTLIDTFDGQRVIVPNRQVFENPLVNYHTTGSRRVEFAVGVAYDTSLEDAARIAREALEPLTCRAPDTDVDVSAFEFGSSSINFRVRYWIPFPGENYVAALHQGVVAVKQAFDAHQIEIPFPIRTLDFSLTEKHAGRFVMDGAKVAAGF